MDLPEEVSDDVQEEKRRISSASQLNLQRKMDKPKSFQYKALIRKTLSLQKRQRCTICCQISVPLIIVLFIGAIQVIFNQLVKNQFDGGYEEPDFKSINDLNGCGKDAPGNFFIGVIPKDQAEIIGTLPLDPTTKGTGLMGLIQHRPCFDPIQKKNVSLPAFIPATEFVDLIDGNKKIKDDRAGLINALKDAENNAIAAVASGKGAKSAIFPRIGLTWNNVTLPDPDKNVPLNFSLEVWKETAFPYLLAYHDAQSTPYWLGAVKIITNALLEFLGHSIQMVFNFRGLPYEQTGLGIDIGSFMAAILYPLVLSWLLPVYIYNIVVEKEGKLIEMMKMMGLKMHNYWIVTWIYNMVLYTAVVIIVYGLSWAFQFSIFTQGSQLAILLSFYLWGNAQIALAFFFATFFNKARLGTIFGYALVLITVVVSFIINATVFQIKDAPFFWDLYPPLAFYRILYLMGILCGVEECPTITDYGWSNEITRLWVYLFIVPFFIYLGAIYFSNVLPKEYGIQKSPWYCFEPIYKCFKRKKKGKPSYNFASVNQSGESFSVNSSEEKVSLLLKSGESEDAAAFEEEPFDVKRERELVYDGKMEHDAPVIIIDLKKTYKGRFGRAKKKAVQNLTLSIPKGECFGLLGPNGAGKTTTISMLTGLFQPSGGSACIGGYDIRTQIDLVHRVMGVCPQFDTLWMDLTCEETLLFYTRLKGIPKKEEIEHVHAALENVGLGHVIKRKAKDLSGGMRRRLSIAVSLVGNPRIIFLDEPTTGLDPESKRLVWEVLTKVKEGRCIILTTHSMEEADVLCTRIGIMANGRLQCIGPQQDLKTRFGQGYTLKINYSEGRQQESIDFVNSVVQNAEIVEEFPGTCTFQIPRQGVLISKLFDAMEGGKSEAGITDWGINQTSLEDVFLTIVRNSES